MSCSPRTSRAPRATRASRWPPSPSATAWPSSRDSRRSPPCPDAALQKMALQARQPVREGVDHSWRRAREVGELERLRDGRARRGEVPPAMLVKLRELLPGLPIERAVTCGDLPERARPVPPGGALLPAHPVGGGAREVAAERGPVTRECLLEIHRFPETAEPCEVLGPQVVGRREGAAEPAEERDE